MNKITNINLELTTVCPLRCPQCYCTFAETKHMPLETAKYWIAEAAANHIRYVALSGGETMCYPHLLEVIAECKKHGLQAAAAFSGYGFTEDSVRKLIDAETDAICISLNGSTEQINAYTRNGYSLAIRALDLLQKAGYTHTILNWVMHSNNADDFPNILTIAEHFGAEIVDIISFKPDSQNQMDSVPTLEQLLQVASQIKAYRGPVKIAVESCFSQMRALVCDTALFGNLNVGVMRGCRAGLAVVSVSVDGLLSPCRHIYEYEAFDHLDTYWKNSKVLEQIRAAEQDIRPPCSECKYRENCRHCLAINKQLNQSFHFGNETCPLGLGDY